MKEDRNDATSKNRVNKCDFHTIISNPWSVGLYIYTHITEIDILYSYIYIIIYIYIQEDKNCAHPVITNYLKRTQLPVALSN